MESNGIDNVVCYLCQDPELDDNDFCHDICNCKGTNRIHIYCFIKLRDKNRCGICKQEFKNIEKLFDEFDLILDNIEEYDKFGWKHKYQVDQFDRKQGIHRIWYQNGNLWEEGQYRDDKRHGYHKVWSYKGELFIEDYYFKGEKL